MTERSDACQIPPFCDGHHSGFAHITYCPIWDILFLPGTDEDTKMTTNAHRLAAFVGHLFDRTAQRQPTDELALELRPDPACRGLNRPYELAELMARTIAP